MNRKQFLRKAAASIAAVALAPVIIDEAMTADNVVWSASNPVSFTDAIIYRPFKFATHYKLTKEATEDIDDMSIIMRDFMDEHLLRAAKQNIKLMEKDVKIHIGTSDDDFAENLLTVILESKTKS